jgi:rubrerythrin
MDNREKLKKLLEHWLSHNVDHAENYRKWAAIAREEGMEQAAAILEEAAELTISLNSKFSKAAESI